MLVTRGWECQIDIDDTCVGPFDRMRKRENTMKWMILLAVLLPVSAFAAGHQDTVLKCVNAMHEGTTWDQCRAQIFEPCQDFEVGSDPHLECLADERALWLVKMDGLRLELFDKLTLDGVNTLNDVGGQWMGYVGSKCGRVGDAMAHISREAAEKGCEISEVVGISAEFQACLAGNSNEPYCKMKE